ncbi:PH domain-containing protein [Psychrobacillus sp. FJAT-51614]|uniref:PH domain-containing protein n=1 Tax=Psychrobacillus mangrovi TaxID=3117745 RepID=A0ABU8F9J9_9BACI
MTFKSKRDRSFINLLIIAIGIIAIATLWPVVFELFYTEAPDVGAIWVMIILFVVMTWFIVWISFDIEYTFKEDYLFIRGGLFRSKIPYEDITKVNRTSDILVGYRILSSKDAIEVHYKKAFMGSVIISPEDQEEFLKVLKEKVPQIHIVK